MQAKTAIKILLGIISSALLLHFAILLKIIPYEITWGGKLTNDSEMYVFETISILINLFLLIVLLLKGQYLKQLIPIRFVNGILLVFLVLFALNTIGNIIAETYFEKCFTVVTLTCAILIWVVLRRKKNY